MSPQEPQALPASPMTELAAAAAQMHELKQAYVEAGFTNAEAMQLLCAVLTAGVRNQRGESGE